jgi:hypothetical protein
MGDVNASDDWPHIKPHLTFARFADPQCQTATHSLWHYRMDRRIKSGNDERIRKRNACSVRTQERRLNRRCAQEAIRQSAIAIAIQNLA